MLHCVGACMLCYQGITLACAVPAQVSGGAPAQLDGNAVLCVRSNQPTGRHFDGQLAYLGLYSSALNASQVGCVHRRRCYCIALLHLALSRRSGSSIFLPSSQSPPTHVLTCRLLYSSVAQHMPATGGAAPAPTAEPLPLASQQLQSCERFDEQQDMPAACLH